MLPIDALVSELPDLRCPDVSDAASCVAVENLLDDRACDFGDVDIHTITSGNEAFAMLCDGSLSLAKYEEWAVHFFRWPTAPYCDFRRYTKCMPLEESLSRAIVPNICLTPSYKKRSSRKNSFRSVPKGCTGTQADFNELCAVFSTFLHSRSQ